MLVAKPIYLVGNIQNLVLSASSLRLAKPVPRDPKDCVSLHIFPKNIQMKTVNGKLGNHHDEKSDIPKKESEKNGACLKSNCR